MKKFSYFFLILFCSHLWAEDWPKWLGPEGTGVSQASNWKNNLEEQAWKAKVGVGFSTVSVADGRLYTMGHDGRKSAGKETVYCLDAKSGETIWTHSYAAPLVDYLHEGGPCSTPTVHGSIVYALSKHGVLHAFKAEDGTVLWKKEMMKEAGMKRPPEWGFAASPCLLGDLLLIEAGATFALDKKTGNTKWKSQAYRAAYGSPSTFKVGNEDLIAVLKTDGLVIFDSANGKTLAFEKWETSYRTNSTTPVVKGDKIFISTGYKRGCALFKWGKGKLSKIYENRNLSTHMNNAIPVGDFLYGFDGNVHMAGPKDFVCIRFSTGEVQWRSKDTGLKVGSLIVAGDRIIALGQRGEVAIARVDPKKFTPLAREQVIGGRCWTPPVLANGLLYLRNARGDLICLDLRK
jgi:outer membrane protein assembly factor BamB